MLLASRFVFMNDHSELAKELIREGDGADHRALVIRNRVFTPHEFDPNLPDFSSKQYVFLNAYRYGTPIEEASAKADLTVDQAERFLDKPKVRAWLADRALKDHIKHEWEEPGRWYAEGERIMKMERCPKHKVEVWKAFGDRVAPAKRLSEGNTTNNVVINIDAGSIQEAKRRKEAIEVEISK